MRPEEYLEMGNRLYRQGQFLEALDLHRRALALEPSSVQLMAAVARDWLALNEPQRALEILSEANRMAPDYQYVHRMLLYVQKLLGLPQELAELNRPPAIGQGTAHSLVTAHKRSADEHSQLIPPTRKTGQGLINAESIPRSSQQQPVLGTGSSISRRPMKPPRSSEISLTPPVVHALDDAHMARLSIDAYELLRRGHPTEALTIARQLVAKDSANAYAHYLLGYALDSLGRYKEAAYAYQMAMTNGRTTGRIVTRLERVRSRIGQEQGGAS